MMHVTPVVQILNPTPVKLLFHNQKRSKEESGCSDNQISDPGRNHHPKTDGLWAENYKVKDMLWRVSINILTTRLTEHLSSGLYVYRLWTLVVLSSNLKAKNFFFGIRILLGNYLTCIWKCDQGEAVCLISCWNIELLNRKSILQLLKCAHACS